METVTACISASSHYSRRGDGGRDECMIDLKLLVSITMKYRIEFSKLTCDYWILLFTRPRMVYNYTLRLEVCASCHIKRFLMSKNCQRDCLYSLDKRIIIRFHLVDICVSSIHKIRVHEYISIQTCESQIKISITYRPSVYDWQL